jgi:hypothetical protein
MTEDYEDRKFTILGINLWESWTIVQNYQNTYPGIIMLRDSGPLWNVYGQNGYIPLNYVLTKDQIIDFWMEGFNEFQMRNHIESCFSPVEVVAVNDGVPIPQGGVLTFDVTLHNFESSQQTFYAQTDVTLPGGTTIVMVGPIQVTLNANQELTVPISHDIPGFAPLGTYGYSVKIGTYPPAELMDWSDFEFEIVAP